MRRRFMIVTFVAILLSVVTSACTGINRNSPTSKGAAVPEPPGRRETAASENRRQGSLPATGGNYILRKVVPILMYHDIGVPKGRWKALYVDPTAFAGQLDWLRANGYTTISLEDLYEHWRNNRPLPAKPIVITFDDGYRSMFQTVLPLLKARNMKATFFLCLSYLNTPKGLETYMVEQLARDGMEIGSHTYSHVELTTLSADKFPLELGESKAELEKIIKKPVEFLCYPIGRVNEKVYTAALEFGYKGAVTTVFDNASFGQDPYQWPRVRINYKDGVPGLVKKLTQKIPGTNFLPAYPDY